MTSGTYRDTTGAARPLSDADKRTVAAAVARAGKREGRHGPGSTVTAELSIGEYRLFLRPDTSDHDIDVVGLPNAPMRHTLMRLDLTLVAAGVGAVLLAAIAGSFIVRRTLRPLEHVASVAASVADLPLGSGDVRIHERVGATARSGGTEVGQVARALDALLDNVDEGLDERRRTEARMRRFVADASHELRTPLTAIKGYTQMLRLTEHLSGEGETSLARLDAQSRRMQSLVEDLLELARLDEGIALQTERLDLGEIVVESLLDASAAGPEHHWSFDVPDDPVEVDADPRRLSQVLANLLSNARKHTPVGTRVRIALAADRTAGAAVVTVSDDGPGIPAEMRSEVFERFTRADAARSGSEPTTGLGLPIARGIVRAHGGELALVEPEAGRGAAFRLTLPLAG